MKVHTEEGLYVCAVKYTQHITDRFHHFYVYNSVQKGVLTRASVTVRRSEGLLYLQKATSELSSEGGEER